MGSKTENTAPSYEEQVKTVLANSINQEGKLEFGEDVPEHMQFAARTLKRQQDTTASFTKSQMKLKALESENEQLATSWEQEAVKNVSSEDRARLEELKQVDPEAWRQELTELEASKRTTLQEKRTEIRKTASQMTEEEQRAETLARFSEANPEINITDDVIQNDIPPRLVKRLEAGEVTFEKFLDDVKGFLTKGRTMQKTESAADEPNLSESRGTSRPSAAAVANQDAADYKNTIF